jgi:hypothetical protein
MSRLSEGWCRSRRGFPIRSKTSRPTTIAASELVMNSGDLRRRNSWRRSALGRAYFVICCRVGARSHDVQPIGTPSCHSGNGGNDSTQGLPTTPSGAIPPFVGKIRSTSDTKEVDSVGAPASRCNGNCLEPGCERVSWCHG